MRTHLVVCTLAMLIVAAPAVADRPSGDESIDVTQILSMAKGAVVATKTDGGDLPKFEDVTKDMESKKGLFTLWSYPASAKDKDKEKLLCQIPASFLGENFMLSISFSGGGFFTGFPLEERVVKWELLGRQLVLIEPETRFVVDRSKTISDVVSRTYPDRIRTAVPLVTKTKSGDPVIDLGPMLKSNFADIAWMSFMGPQAMLGSSINAALSKWTKKKTFELNVELGVELAVKRRSPPGSFDKKLVHFSFWKLPKSDYKPRVADDRVGYFLTANQDWSRATGARDLFNRYVDRWNLQKRDPSLKMCEPKTPITFYVEKTVPVRYRRAVRDGIVEWNRAFEKVGFVNAVEVRQQTEDNEWKDLDPEDMRYSFFRWIVTGAGFAMGPHRANPFTGQIYDADIIFDDSMVRFFEQDAQQHLLPAAAVARKFSDPALADFLDRFPQWKRPTREWENFSFGNGAEERRLRNAVRRRMRERGHQCCDYADGMKHQMAVSHTMLVGQSPDVIEGFLYDVIKEVVMHEVGHTLGLRHNFKASSIWSIDEIKKRRADGKSTTGSVMDYNPVLFFKDKQLAGNFLTPTIGPYDYWAIEYGYRPANDASSAKAAKAAGGKGESAMPEKGDTPKPGVSTGTSVEMSEIPQDVLDQLPPEVRKMIASGAVKRTAGGDSRGGAPAKASPGSMFTSASSGELKMLREIASRAGEPELAYSTDEDTTFLGPDPRSNRFDMGADPIEWAETRMELIDTRMSNILDWAVKDEESWYHLRGAFVRLLFEKTFVLDYVGRYIGGQHTNRSHRGDPDARPPFVIVPAERQRKALAFIEKHLFDDRHFKIPSDVLNHLAVPRWWHDGASVSRTVDFPIHSYVGMLQWWNLFDRLFPNTLRRIHDAELKTASADKLTVAEYIGRVQKACWSGTTDADRASDETWTDESPYVSSIRRSLQREYLNVIEPLVRTKPGLVVSPDIHAMVQHSLQKLNNQIERVLDGGNLDFASEAHLASCRSRIDRMLAPELQEYTR
ncbi:MAG: zinc-dependent metalloprotease [Planctomycetota bacterium]|nr:zinc-dependent metalloprotease [Planctomycetota bacterium]